MATALDVCLDLGSPDPIEAAARSALANSSIPDGAVKRAAGANTTGSADNNPSAELTITSEGIHSMFPGLEKSETVKPLLQDKKVSMDAVAQSDTPGNDLTLTAQDSSISRRRQCPALDFEQLKMKLGQLTASKKVKPDPQLEVPDGKESTQADPGSGATAPPVIPPTWPSYPSSTMPEAAASGMNFSSALQQMADSMLPGGPKSSDENQEMLGQSGMVLQTELRVQANILPQSVPSSANDSAKGGLTTPGFSSAASAPNIPALHSIGQLPPVLDPRQMYMYLSALQSQTMATLNPVDLLLLSAIQGQQAYHDMYLQPMQQMYSSGSPGINTSYAMNQPQFLAQQNALFGATLATDWHRASMMYGLQAMSVPDMSQQAAAAQQMFCFSESQESTATGQDDKSKNSKVVYQSQPSDTSETGASDARSSVSVLVRPLLTSRI